eukprot:SM000329S12574  [mRNA]  locus=s329:19218:22724:- [translate_table: standard]
MTCGCAGLWRSLLAAERRLRAEQRRTAAEGCGGGSGESASGSSSDSGGASAVDLWRWDDECSAALPELLPPIAPARDLPQLPGGAAYGGKSATAEIRLDGAGAGSGGVCGGDSPSGLAAAAGLFALVVGAFVEGGVHAKRLQVWRARIAGLGGRVVDAVQALSPAVTHIFATDARSLQRANLDAGGLRDKVVLRYEWVEDCLKDGRLLPTSHYCLISAAASSAQSPVATTAAASGATAPAAEAGLRARQRKRKAGASVSDSQCKFSGSAPPTDSNAAQLLPAPPELGLGTEDKDEEAPEADEVYAPPDVNAHLTGPLAELQQIYEFTLGDSWRALTYKKAVSTLEKLPWRISNAEQLASVQGIGKSMLNKVKELLASGTIGKLEALKSSPQVHLVQQFASVWGIGPTIALSFYNAGCRTLQDIAKQPSLSAVARLGLKYHADLLLKMPRKEAADIVHIVQRNAELLCPGVNVTATGSYRRGKAMCSDIDFVITHDDGCSHRGLLARLVQHMQNTGFFASHHKVLEHSYPGMEQVETFMGICRSPAYPCFRRIDIKVYPRHQLPFALIAFTGNDVLNRKIRYRAMTMGYKLNDKGLFPRACKQAQSNAMSLSCQTEREIFERLGLDYLEPHKRNW